jgi:hypothetical protein
MTENTRHAASQNIAVHSKAKDSAEGGPHSSSGSAIAPPAPGWLSATITASTPQPSSMAVASSFSVLPFRDVLNLPHTQLRDAFQEAQARIVEKIRNPPSSAAAATPKTYLQATQADSQKQNALINQAEAEAEGSQRPEKKKKHRGGRSSAKAKEVRASRAV